MRQIHGTRVAAVLAVLALGVTTGCSASVGGSNTVKGTELAKLVNKTQMKNKNHPVTSKITCPDAKLVNGTEVQCTQTAEFSAGRRVVIGVIVKLSKVDKSKGTYHYNAERVDNTSSFGMAGKFIEKDLATQWQQQNTTAADVSCPDYLPGKVGSSIVCALREADDSHRVKVTVDKVDPASFDTHYTYLEQ